MNYNAFKEDMCLNQTALEGRQMFFNGLIAKTKEYHEQGMVCRKIYNIKNGAYEALKIAENVQ